jgi:hypothetical protein
MQVESNRVRNCTLQSCLSMQKVCYEDGFGRKMSSLQADVRSTKENLSRGCLYVNIYVDPLLARLSRQFLHP